MFGGNDDLLADSTGTHALTYINAPERVLDQELGLRYARSKWHLNTNLYYMGFKNEIVLNGKFGANGLALNSHVSKSYRAGLELDLGVQIKPWCRYQVAASYNHSVIANQGLSFQPILTPKWLMNHELLLTLKNVFVGLELRYQSASYIDFANEHTIGSYVLANIKLGYTYHKTWEFTFRLNNAFNAKYYNNGSVDTAPKYFVQAPINYNLALVYTY
jgi:iron complex outermembrane receptor protein